MKLLRSWPKNPPPGRPHVVDSIPRLEMDNYDYSVLAQLQDDVLLLEWDIAVGKDELVGFARRAAATPNQVLVAPYRHYPEAYGADPSSGFPQYGFAQSTWVHRYWSGPADPNMFRFVETGAPWCNLWGFGLTYLPQQVITGYLNARQVDWGFDDTSLSEWHFRFVEQRVPIDWDTRPVHLHYAVPVEQIETEATKAGARA